jgi:hypothetical protein
MGSNFMALPFNEDVFNLSEVFSIHFFTPRPEIMGNVIRNGEKTLDEQIRTFEIRFGREYPLNEIVLQYKKFSH